MQSLSFNVRGMTCGGCSGNVQGALRNLDGVSHAGVSMRHGIATLVPDPVRATLAQIESAIVKLRYPSTVRPTGQGQKAQP